MNALLKGSTIAAKGKSKAALLKTMLAADDGSDDIELLRIMFKRSRIRNPLQATHTVRDAICCLEGARAYAVRKMFPFPTLLLLDVQLPDGSQAAEPPGRRGGAEPKLRSHWQRMVRPKSVTTEESRGHSKDI